jgi:hypothetical protein
MLEMGVTIYRSPVSGLHASLWRCKRCDSFVSIHSPQIVEQALCPIWGIPSLEFCRTFQSVLGLQFADA